MATSTTNLGLIKPAGSDKIRIAQINQNSDILDAAIGAVGATSLQTQVNNVQDALAIIANGDTHPAITAGQFVYVKNNTHSVAEGLHVATANISANGQITTSNVSADASGGLNALNSKINTNTSDIQNISLDLSAKTVYTGDVFSAPAGTYRVTGAASNLPVNANGYLNVTYRASDTKLLEYMTDSGRFFTNTLNGANWTGWNEYALKSEFSKTNLQSVSPYSSRCEGLAGGYIKVGNIVFVSIIGKASVNTSNNDLIIGGLPKPNSTNLPLAGQNDSTHTVLNAVVNQNGYIGAGALAANNYFTISGSYISLE